MAGGPLSRHLLSKGPLGLLGVLLWGPEVQGSQTVFPTSHTGTSLIWGRCHEKEPRVPRGVRKEKLEGCILLLTSPSPDSSCLPERNEGFGVRGPKALLDGTYQLLLFL